MASIAADILALVELVVVLHVLLHGFANRVVLVVVHYVGISYVLGVDTSSSFDQRELLRIQVLIRIRCKSSTHGLFLILFVVATGCEVR